MYTEGTVMVYAVPGEKNRVTARTVYTEVRVNRGEGVIKSSRLDPSTYLLSFVKDVEGFQINVI